MRELRISVTGVLSGAVQFFRVECFNLLVGGVSELLGGSEKGLNFTSTPYSSSSAILGVLKSDIVLI